jgi:hypothetical protein
MKQFYRLGRKLGTDIDHARGEGLVESSEEGGDSDKSDTDEDATIEFPAASSHRRSHVVDVESNPRKDSNHNEVQPTLRIAVVNLDWDHVKAPDLYRMFSSQLPSSSKDANTPPHIVSVTVYLSTFGASMLARELVTGPSIQPIANTSTTPSRPSGLSGDQEDGDSIEDNEALRKYQLQRMQFVFITMIFFQLIFLPDTIMQSSHVILPLPPAT